MAKGFPNFKVTVSNASNAIYVYVGDPKDTVVRTESEAGSILVDLNQAGQVVGVEFLGVQGKRLEVDSVLDKYATHQPDSPITHEGAYILRALSLIEWKFR